MMNMISGNGIMAFAPPLPPPPETSVTFQNPDYDGATVTRLFAGVDRPWDNRELRADDDTSDDGSSQLGEKKRRLSLDQVKALEKSFELGNKLEPERKMQLARALGLQPRQIAIWFQNRRARSKTKQLEKDYDLLKRQFEVLSADNGALKSQNKKLHSELMALRSRESNGVGPTTINLNQETEGSWNNVSENSSIIIDVNLGSGSTRPSNKHVLPPPLPPPPQPPSSITTTNFAHLLHASSRPDLYCSKVDPTVQDEGYCNMFGAAMDEHAEFLATTFPLNFSFS